MLTFAGGPAMMADFETAVAIRQWLEAIYAGYRR